MVSTDDCDRCDWPGVGKKILGDLARLETTEKATGEILQRLAELKADVRALDEKFERLEDHGTAYAHREVHELRKVLQDHALKLEAHHVKIGFLAVFFGIVGGAISGLLAWVFKS